MTQAAPYRTGPTPQVSAPYQVGAPSSSYEVAVPPPPELARTGVLVDAYDRRVEARWGADDPFYAATVRGGAAAAQSRQGSLDGGWTVAGLGGPPLYALQLADAGQGVVDGAWRAIGPDGGGGPAASGFIALIGREAGRVVLRFLEPGSSTPTAITVEMTVDGAWRGEMARAGGRPTPVVMRRR